jgi:DNA polymerase-3 subunit gamma/tau
VEGKTVIIAFPESKKFHYKGAASNKALVARVLRNVLSEAVELEFRLGAKKKINNNQGNKAEDSAVQNENVDFVEDSSPAAAQQSSGSNQDQISETDEIDMAPKNINQDLKNKDKKENNSEAEEPASQESDKKTEPAGDLDIENLARIFSGEIIEVDQSILENRGGN